MIPFKKTLKSSNFSLCTGQKQSLLKSQTPSKPLDLFETFKRDPLLMHTFINHTVFYICFLNNPYNILHQIFDQWPLQELPQQIL